MKFIKGLLKKIKAKLTIKTHQKPLAVTLGSIFALNLVVLVIAAFIANAIDVNKVYFTGFWSAFCTGSIKWMVAANSVLSFKEGQAYDGDLTLLCGIVVAIEMILFSGIIIASTTTALKGFIDKKMSAKGKLPLDNHIVILNWNNKIPEMILDMINNGEKNTILILSNKDKQYILDEINSVIYTNNRSKECLKIQLVIRNGEPILKSELADIAIDRASKIFIMSREDLPTDDNNNITNSDLYSLKIMMAFTDFNMLETSRIVIETEEDKSRLMLENLIASVSGLSNLDIIPISFNKKLGQILGQVIIEPKLSNIYMDLFSYEGCEFYAYKDISVDDYLSNYNGGIPIINYGKLFVLSNDISALGKKRSKPINEYRKLKKNLIPDDEHLTIFTIANNSKSPYLIENLQIYKNDHPQNFDMINFSKEQYNDLIDAVNTTKGRIKILILSDDKVKQESLDANVFISLIALKSKVKDNKNISYITEILDSRNLNSVLDFDVQNAIVSNKLISLLLVQIAFNKNAKKFFDSLLTIDSVGDNDIFDIKVSKIKNIIDVNDNLSFSSQSELVYDMYYSFDKYIMPIGLITNENGKEEIMYFTTDIDNEWNYTLKPDDKLIYIKY